MVLVNLRGGSYCLISEPEPDDKIMLTGCLFGESVVRRMISCCLMKIFGRDLAGPLPPRSHPRPNLVLDAFFKGEGGRLLVVSYDQSSYVLALPRQSVVITRNIGFNIFITLFAALSELFTIAVLGSILSFWS